MAATATGRITPDQLTQARQLYYAGIYGDKAASDKADDLLTKLHAEYPEDPLATVYFGSMRLLEAKRTWALWKKNSLSKQGVQLMDSAVAGDPGNLEVRFVRGATERELPAFFGRKQQAQDDLHTVISSPNLKTLEPRLAAAAYYYYALEDLSAGRRAEARAGFLNAVRTAPESHAGGLAAEKLKALP